MFITLLCWLSENSQKLLLNKHWDGNDVETVIMLMAHKTEAGWDVLISTGWICRYSTHPLHCPYHVSCTCKYMAKQVFNAPCTLFLGPYMYLNSGYVGCRYSTHLLPLLQYSIYFGPLCFTLPYQSYTLYLRSSVPG